MEDDEMMVAAITTTNILTEVISVIFNKAVEEPTLCPTYSRLLCDLNTKLPPLPSEKSDGKKIIVKGVLFDIVWNEHLGDLEKPTKNLEIIRFVGELWKQDMIPGRILHDIIERICKHRNPSEESVEAMCDLFYNVNKWFDESMKFMEFLWITNLRNFNNLEELRTNPKLAPRLRFFLHDVLFWCEDRCNYSFVLDPKLYTDDDHRKIVSFMEEYFSSHSRNLGDAYEFVENLESGACYPEIVMESIVIALNKSPPQVMAVGRFLVYLFFHCRIFSESDIKRGCLLFAGSMVDCDSAGYLRKVASNFGEIIGELVFAEVLDLKAVREILDKVHSDSIRRAIMENVVRFCLSLI